MRMLDLFSGIGGFSLAASWTGVIEPVLFCEIDPFCKRILSKHWPHVPIHDDITTLKVGAYASASTIDIVCGGFPCQPFSVAGKRQGEADDRHLWPQMLRIIQETRPRWVVGENVAGLIRLGIDEVLSDLESADYSTQVFVIPACAVDAPHRRDRLWVLAHTSGLGCQRSIGAKGGENKGRRGLAQVPVAGGGGVNGGRWLPEPGLGRVAHGVPNRVDRLRALGNAIVPQVAYRIFKAIVEVSCVENAKT